MSARVGPRASLVGRLRGPGGAAAVLVVLAGVVVAQPKARVPGAIVDSYSSGLRVDWTRGVVIAPGVGPADRHAPEPAVARVAAERKAIDRARFLLADAATTLLEGAPLDDAARAAVAREVAAAPVVTRELGTDGSVRVELGLGLEALRQAVAGPRALAPGADEGAPPVVVVDARAFTVEPSVRLGLASAGAGGTWSGPISFVTEPPVGQGGARAVTAAAAGTLTIDGAPPAPGARAIVVIDDPRKLRPIRRAP